MVSRDLQTKVVQFVQDEGLVCVGDKVIVAVSGGPDSVTLLDVFHKLRYALGIHLIVAHYNHALRTSAAHDQAFVKKVAAQMGLPFVTETNRMRIPEHVSVEEFARKRRYAFFQKVVRATKADCVALAHTRDDLAETVLMRILRGAGLAGLRAILPKRDIYGMKIIRPLLTTSRAEVEGYIDCNNLTFVRDPSNSSLDYFRNRIRLRVLPYLEKHVGRDVKTNLAGLAAVSTCDYDLIDQQAARLYKTMARKQGQKVILSLRKWIPLHAALRRSLLRTAIAEVRGDLNAIGQGHITDIEQLALSSEVESRLDLPRGIVVYKSVTDIIIHLQRR